MREGIPMKPLQIQTNVALEFVFSMMGIAYFEKYEHKDQDITNSRFDIYISDYVKSIYSQIPHLVKNDIRLFLHDFSCVYLTLLSLVIHEKVKTPQDLIQYFSRLSNQEFLDLYLETNSTELTLQSPKDEIETALDELSIAMHQDAKDQELFHEFENYPDVLLTRFIHAMKLYYEQFFSSQEQELTTQLNRLVQVHQEFYDNNPEAFNSIILSFDDTEKLSHEYKEIHIYVSQFFGERVQVAFEHDYTVHIFYGAGMEKKFYAENLNQQYEELIKSLADDTRRALIKMLMHEPHYNKEISDHLGITTATVSYHLNKLGELGIIHIQYQEGKRIYHQVDKDKFNLLFDGLKAYLGA
jgi:DNA-binding transcriptional ArsR family regulator